MSGGRGGCGVCCAFCRRCEQEKAFKRRYSPVLTPCGGKSRIFGEVVSVYIEERLLDGRKFNEQAQLPYDSPFSEIALRFQFGMSKPGFSVFWGFPKRGMGVGDGGERRMSPFSWIVGLMLRS